MSANAPVTPPISAANRPEAEGSAHRPPYGEDSGRMPQPMPKLLMYPAPGERLSRFVGDRLRFSLRHAENGARPDGWRTALRTNLGRASSMRDELITSVQARRPPTHLSWRDIPLTWQDGEWRVELPLTEVGYFQAKAYALDPDGWQHWPDGPDIGVAVQPNACRTANTIYCAFTRMFGPSKTATHTVNTALPLSVQSLDDQGYAVIPPSGTLRDLAKELPHIIDTLGCRILHLLPVQPTPTTYARFGRFGSPYACLNLTAIDPALIEFDKRTTGIDQFRELARAVHSRGARLFLDMVINHTGWGSIIQENHPEWFLRQSNGSFVSPGAWGTTWEDLVEFDHANPALRECLAEAFLEWLRRGVDGFRCDAGYKVPIPVWRYITARVRQEFPDAIFLVEGLGGSWHDTEALLTEGGMQWAYSELFQNFSGAQIASYLDHTFHQSRRVGLLAHYSETHDNDRLAARGRAWSLSRNRLCALTSIHGAFGFTCGVEWLAPERINVHSSRGLAWGAADNLVAELGRLNRLLQDHPCFFDGANLTRLSTTESPVYALLRASAEGVDAVLVLANTDPLHPQQVVLDEAQLGAMGLVHSRPSEKGDRASLVDLLGQVVPVLERTPNAKAIFTLGPGEVFCLAPQSTPRGLSGDAYRRRQACAALALAACGHRLPIEQIGTVDTLRLAEWMDRDPAGFLSATTYLEPASPKADLLSQLLEAARLFPRVVTWRIEDRTRITLVPPRHWILIEDRAPFRARLEPLAARFPVHVESIPVLAGHIACIPPFEPLVCSADARLEMERYEADPAGGKRQPAGESVTGITATLRLLPESPCLTQQDLTETTHRGMVLLANGRGAMSRLCVDLGRITSKYDCLLGANLHPSLPVDRHVFVKRARVWVNADGFLSPLNAENLASFSPGPPAHWSFVANAGDGRSVAIELAIDMLQEQNAVVLRFDRPSFAASEQKGLPDTCDVRLTVRLDIEDRNFHFETRRSASAEHHFEAHTRALADRAGFSFTPTVDRQLRAFASGGRYHPQGEWCENIPHPVEITRGMSGAGDAFSPGWFDLPLPRGAAITLVVTSEPDDPDANLLANFASSRGKTQHRSIQRAHLREGDDMGHALVLASRAFVVRRGTGKTVIAGYPWFLDWGRDTLICARGLLAAGMNTEVLEILRVFGRFESGGTLPNTIHGEDASNRDTSDAPLWYGIVYEELAERLGTVGPSELSGTRVEPGGRTLAQVLRSIAVGYIEGTKNGIRMDPSSGLVWSPSHFTWMDTNHPAATPREGYPVCIQALWVRLLLQLARLEVAAPDEPWEKLAQRARTSFDRLFWLEERGYLADTLLAPEGVPAAGAAADTALRSNCLIPVALGFVTGDRARRCVAAAWRHLVVPGALRSLAPLPATPPLPIRGSDGRLLNTPAEPYWGSYQGDEDTRRKPAYHNGTAWTWTFPTFCEAMARAWDFSTPAVLSARACLGSLDHLLNEGCVE